MCDEAKLADLTVAVQVNTQAVEVMTEKLGRVLDALNVLGAQSEAHTAQVNEIVQQVGAFGSSMGKMGPGGILKMLTGKVG